MWFFQGRRNQPKPAQQASFTTAPIVSQPTPVEVKPELREIETPREVRHETTPEIRHVPVTPREQEVREHDISVPSQSGAHYRFEKGHIENAIEEVFNNTRS